MLIASHSTRHFPACHGLRMSTEKLPKSWRGAAERAYDRCFEHVRILSGRDADRRLAACAARAQAVDASTLLVSAAFYRSPPHLRNMILSHELAHTVQLARGGSDDVDQLESEAWAAAWHAQTGRDFEVTGRGSAPLCAKLFICATGSHGRNIDRYYRRFPHEPIVGGMMDLDPPITVTPATFDVLLQRIISSQAREILIAAHGTTEGLTVPLVRAQRARPRTQANSQGLWAVMRAPGEAEDREIQRDYRITARQLTQLRGLMRDVRALGIRRVEFRACNLGFNVRAALTRLRRFFGAQTASAPDCYDGYVSLDPGTPDSDAAVWDHWVDHRADIRYTRFFVNGSPVASFPQSPGGRVGVYVNHNGGLRTGMMTDSWPAVQAFVGAMFPSISQPYQSGAFPAHFMYTLARAIYPMEQEFRNHLTQVTATP